MFGSMADNLQEDGLVYCQGLNCSETTFSSTTANVSSVMTENDVPKGYSVPHIILTSILISVIMFVIVFGNLLVVIAIFTDKTLKTTQNWFIASLAVADFLLGLVIMPFSLANEMMGYWYFGKVWCDLWKAIDVLLCTASILSICLISLDRYWSITRALKYSRQRTGKRAALMIAAVWFLSAVICVPPLIGWKNPLPVSDYPLCLLSDDIGYVLYSTMGSFYIPCVIMVFVYFKIYLAARRLARKNVSGKPIKVHMRVELKDKISMDSPTKSEHKHMNDRRSDVINEKKKSSSNEGSLYSDIPHESHAGTPADSRHCSISNCTTLLPDTQHNVDDCDKMNNEVSTNTHQLLSEDHETQSDENHRDATMVVKQNMSSEKNGHSEATDSSKTFMKNIGRSLAKTKHRYNGNKNKNSKGWRTASLREHERHKKKIAKARERRATIVLGLVMAAFILCWFPFFTLYIITSFCYCIEEIVFTVVFWAGYCNSALNPIIYTIFNRDFRQAFHRIVCKTIRRR